MGVAATVTAARALVAMSRQCTLASSQHECLPVVAAPIALRGRRTAGTMAEQAHIATSTTTVTTAATAVIVAEAAAAAAIVVVPSRPTAAAVEDAATAAAVASTPAAVAREATVLLIGHRGRAVVAVAATASMA